MAVVYFNECSDKIFYNRTKSPLLPYLLPNVHCHANYEVLFIISGGIWHFTDYGSYYLAPGDFLLIPPYVKHQSYHNVMSDRILISFFLSHLKSLDGQMLNCFHTLHIKAAWSLFPILEEIEKEYNRDDTESAYAVEALTSLFLIRLSRINAVSPTPESSPLMEQVKKDIIEHYMLDISLDDLAYKYNMSKSHFSKKFKNDMGIGLHDFLTLVRIQNAERLLITTSESITTIASMCGFNDSSHFTQTFKKTKGMTPKEYKKNNKA